MNIWLISYVTVDQKVGCLWHADEQFLLKTAGLMSADKEKFFVVGDSPSPVDIEALLGLGTTASNQAISTALLKAREVSVVAHAANPRPSSMNPADAMAAIEARLKGDFKHPALVEFGLLSLDAKSDILELVSIWKGEAAKSDERLDAIAGKYNVDLHGMIHVTKTVSVVACSEIDARRVALQMAKQGSIEWEQSGVEDVQCTCVQSE